MRSGVLGVAAILALGLAGPEPAAAADADGRFAGHGWAVGRCSQLMEAIEAEDPSDRDQFVGWVGGFITGANVYKSSTFDLAPLAPPEILANIIAQECRQNPEAAVVEVMVAVARELEGQRLESSRPILDLEYDGRAVRIHREILRRTQAALKELGHYDGGVDGAYGPQTRAALLSFQEQAGVPPTGLPDQRTLLAIFFNIGTADAGGG